MHVDLKWYIPISLSCHFGFTFPATPVRTRARPSLAAGPSYGAKRDLFCFILGSGSNFLDDVGILVCGKGWQAFTGSKKLGRYCLEIVRQVKNPGFFT
jgi:hypothetical protein